MVQPPGYVRGSHMPPGGGFKQMGGDSMNKMVKGSVAGATGIVLLMGGFGTYALWSDSATVPGGNVTSGTLNIESGGAATWKDLSTDSVSTTWDPAKDKMVPGDTIEMT